MILRTLLITVLAFVAGQEAMKYFYDPETLEVNALAMVEASYRRGCIRGTIGKAKGKPTSLALENCAKFAKAERKDAEDVFHDAIWKKKRK